MAKTLNERAIELASEGCCGPGTDGSCPSCDVPLEDWCEQCVIEALLNLSTAETTARQDMEGAVSEAHEVLDKAGIAPGYGAICDDPACQTKLGHRVRVLAMARQEAERERDGYKDSFDDICRRSEDAHDYAQAHCMPDAAGRNVWHTVLDDAIALRAEIATLRHPLPDLDHWRVGVDYLTDAQIRGVITFLGPLP